MALPTLKRRPFRIWRKFWQPRRSNGPPGGTPGVLSAKEPLTALLPVGYDAAKLEKTLAVPDEIKAPVAEGETVGTITYVYDGTELGKIELISKTAVKKSYMRMIFGTLFHYLLSVWVMVPLGVLVAVILVLRWMEHAAAEEAPPAEKICQPAQLLSVSRACRREIDSALSLMQTEIF